MVQLNEHAFTRSSKGESAAASTEWRTKTTKKAPARYDVKRTTQIQKTSQSFAETKYLRVEAREHTLAPPGRHRPRHSRMSLTSCQNTPAIDGGTAVTQLVKTRTRKDKRPAKRQHRSKTSSRSRKLQTQQHKDLACFKPCRVDGVRGASRARRRRVDGVPPSYNSLPEGPTPRPPRERVY